MKLKRQMQGLCVALGLVDLAGAGEGSGVFRDVFRQG